MSGIIDPGSATWLSLRKIINERIEKLRDDLELPGMPPEELRGEIAALKWLKKQVEPDPKIVEPTGTDYLQARAPDPS